jgi:hypothetical protein
MRQYEALKSLGCLKANLRKAVFCEPIEGSEHNRSIVSDNNIQPSKPASVISDVWDVISRQTNAYQLSTIESVMLGKARENVTLLQGPPGRLMKAMCSFVMFLNISHSISSYILIFRYR